MPLVYQQNINPQTSLGVWQITEEESFFLKEVPLERDITHPHKRLQHLAGRYLLKVLYPNFPYELIRIAATRKPYLANEACHFSISHCADYAAVVISETYRVGVDVEKVTERVHRVRHKFMDSQEIQLLEQLAAAGICDLTTLLTVCWSMKESLFKWYGSGELDFKEHLHIESMNWQDMQGTAQCMVSKETNTLLNIPFRIMSNLCLSWVYSEPPSL